MRKTRVSTTLAAAAVVWLGAFGCSQNSTYQKNLNDANTKGKYKVRLTTNIESVVGICKFMGNVEPEQDPVGGIPKSQYADYFRVQAVLMGADTVLVRGD